MASGSPYSAGSTTAIQPYSRETELQQKALSALKQSVGEWDRMSTEIAQLLAKEASFLRYFQAIFHEGTGEDRLSALQGAAYKGFTNPLVGIAGGASLGLLIAGPIGAAAGLFLGPGLQQVAKRSLKGVITPPIHASLDLLVDTTVEYLRKLYNHLYSDDGLQGYITALNNDAIRLGQLAIDKSRERGPLSESIAKSKTELDGSRAEYKQKYGNLKYEQLPIEAIELTAAITQAEKALQDKQFGLKGLEQQIEACLRTAEQNKVVRNAILVSFVEGEGVYNVINSALTENEGSIKGITHLAKGAQLTVKSAELYAYLRKFFSRALLQASQQAKVTAENAEYLVPPNLVDDKSLDEARGNIEEAARMMLERGSADPRLLELAGPSSGKELPPSNE